jgi:hypothetical protein
MNRIFLWYKIKKKQITLIYISFRLYWDFCFCQTVKIWYTQFYIMNFKRSHSFRSFIVRPKKKFYFILKSITRSSVLQSQHYCFKYSWYVFILLLLLNSDFKQILKIFDNRNELEKWRKTNIKFYKLI